MFCANFNFQTRPSIEVNHNEFTPEYVALTKDFYLKM